MGQKGKLDELKRAAAGAGDTATYVARMAIYGTRRFPSTNAGDGPTQAAAVGIPPGSVWQGTQKIRGGAPILRRNRPA